MWVLIFCINLNNPQNKIHLALINFMFRHFHIYSECGCLYDHVTHLRSHPLWPCFRHRILPRWVPAPLHHHRLHSHPSSSRSPGAKIQTTCFCSQNTSMAACFLSVYSNGPVPEWAPIHSHLWSKETSDPSWRQVRYLPGDLLALPRCPQRKSDQETQTDQEADIKTEQTGLLIPL